MFSIAVLISGGGSNLQSILDNMESGCLNCRVEAVISDREGCGGIERARLRGIKTCVLDRKIYGQSLSDEILKILNKKADLIVLAGFLSILRGDIIKEFKNKIINIHPSLLPAFCGSGMHGMKVHEKVIEYGAKYSGCTVHFVDEGTDSGPIITQRIVRVLDEDTPESLQKKILIEEHMALPQVIRNIMDGNIKISGRRVVGGGYND